MDKYTNVKHFFKEEVSGWKKLEIKAERKKYSEILKQLFMGNGVKYYSISGDYLERFNKAKELIEKELKITTQF